MRNFYYLLLILFSFQYLCAQKGLLTKEEIIKQYNTPEIAYPTTEEDIKKIESLIESSKKIDFKKGMVNGKMKLIFFYKERSEYRKMLELIGEIEKLEPETNIDFANLNFYKGIANKELGMEDQALRNLHDGVKYAKLIEDPDRMHMVTSNMYNAIAWWYDHKSSDSLFHYQKKELEELEKVSDKDPHVRAVKYRSIALNKINMGTFYVDVHKPQRLDLAEPYFMEVYNYRTTKPDIFEDMDLQILNMVGNFYISKGDYKKSIELLNDVLQREKRKKNPEFRVYAYSALADAYEGMKNPQEQAKYTKLYAALNDSLNTAAKKEVNHQFEKLVTKAEKRKDRAFSSILFIIGCFILVSVFAIWLLWKRNSRIVHKKYEELIAKINIENEQNINPIVAAETIEDYETKSILNITDETTKILLQKLAKFEKSHKYLRKDVTRSWLSDHLNTNNSYLTEIIKVRSSKNFNNYLNGLRIDYITKKLVENPVYREYKIEYLAEECGYGSRQVFVIAFKKETGFTPSYFIENLKRRVINEYRE